MKKHLLLMLLSLITVSSCGKSGDEEVACYQCETFRERTYTGGILVKDTVPGQLCNTQTFIDAYIKNGTFDGESWEKTPDSVKIYLKLKTTCNKR
jgi:hypothetical protein